MNLSHPIVDKKRDQLSLVTARKFLVDTKTPQKRAKHNDSHVFHIFFLTMDNPNFKFEPLSYYIFVIFIFSARSKALLTFYLYIST